MDWKYLLTNFNGRINRQPFWLSFVTLALVTMALIWGIMAALGTWTPTGEAGSYSIQMSPLGWALCAVVYVALIWFGLAIQIKRWHDRNKSGWWVLIGLVPVIGGIWALVETGFLSGTPGDNRFGPDPLA